MEQTKEIKTDLRALVTFYIDEEDEKVYFLTSREKKGASATLVFKISETKKKLLMKELLEKKEVDKDNFTFVNTIVTHGTNATISRINDVVDEYKQKINQKKGA